MLEQLPRTLRMDAYMADIRTADYAPSAPPLTASVAAANAPAFSLVTAPPLLPYNQHSSSRSEWALQLSHLFLQLPVCTPWQLLSLHQPLAMRVDMEVRR
jgi:hypothetical protein